MDKKMDAFKLMTKKGYELEEKKNEMEDAKEQYREVLVNQAIDYVLTVLKEDGKLTERDLKIFLGDLSLQTKQLYSK
jgi:hypothetical protein